MNKITNKTFKMIQSWLDDQSIGETIFIGTGPFNGEYKCLYLDTTTMDYKEYVVNDDEQ